MKKAGIKEASMRQVVDSVLQIAPTQKAKEANFQKMDYQKVKKACVLMSDYQDVQGANFQRKNYQQAKKAAIASQACKKSVDALPTELLPHDTEQFDTVDFTVEYMDKAKPSEISSDVCINDLFKGGVGKNVGSGL